MKTMQRYHLQLRNVLIEPYWNVNENNAEVSAAAEKRINRTILECKSEQAQQIEQNKTGINRTILECKFF